MRALLWALGLLSSCTRRSSNNAEIASGAVKFVVGVGVLVGALPRAAATEERCRRDCTLPVNVTKLEWEARNPPPHYSKHRTNMLAARFSH
jgi:hypothetical protein